MFGLGAANLHVRSHHTARDVGHAAGHDAHQLGLSKLREKRPDSKRSFSLPHEDAGGDVEGLRTARAHDTGHNPGSDADDQLHHPKVIKDREERSNEYDGWQDLEGKDEAQGRISLTKLTENKSGADVGNAQEFRRVLAGLLEEPAPGVRAQHKEAKHQLKSETPGDGLELDRAAVGGEQPRQAQNHGHAQYSGETSHEYPSPKWIKRQSVGALMAAFLGELLRRCGNSPRCGSSLRQVLRRYCNES